MKTTLTEESKAMLEKIYIEEGNIEPGVEIDPDAPPAFAALIATPSVGDLIRSDECLASDVEDLTRSVYSVNRKIIDISLFDQECLKTKSSQRHGCQHLNFSLQNGQLTHEVADKVKRSISRSELPTLLYVQLPYHEFLVKICLQKISGRSTFSGLVM